nr:hypothetical protein [Tanacetum cinerariifolium]
MNQNFYNSNSFGFDQIRPPQYYVMHQHPEESINEFEEQPKTLVISALEGVIQPPRETSVEILHARKNLMKYVQTFLKKFNRISFRETPKVLSQAWDKFFEIQHAQPEDIQELLHQLLKDLQIINEELAEYINSPSWNRPAFYDDDDEYSIQYKKYLENSSKAIAPVLPTEEPDNSLSMRDEHLSTISETKSDEVIKSSVENLVLIPSEFEDFSDNEKSNSEISDATIKSSSPSPIPVEDSDSLMEEIDLFLDPDDLIPSSIESDDYDSEGDILFLKELLRNDSLSLLEFESFHFDFYDDPSSPRPPEKPPDDGGILTTNVVDDISDNSTREPYVHMLNVLPSQPTLCLNIDNLLPFSSENEDKVFNPGILSFPLLSHRGKITFDFSKSPMMISGRDIPFLDALFLHFYPP